MKLRKSHDLIVDLSRTLTQVIDAKSASDCEPIRLSGLYRFSSARDIIELELIEHNSLRRTIIYVSKEPTYLLLPDGRYVSLFRLISGGNEGGLRVAITRLSPLEVFLSYGAKAFQLGLSFKRWRSALRSRRVSRTRAVGMTLAKDPSPRTIERDTSRPLIELPPVAKDTAVSIIIPTKIRKDLLSRCLESLAQIEGVSYEVIVVDNGAFDPDMVEYLCRVNEEGIAKVHRLDIPFNFSTLCNYGTTKARYPLLLFLNDDIEALDGTWLRSMCRHAQKAGVGAVGARLLYPSMDLQHGGIATHLVPGPGHPWRNVSKDVWSNHPLLSTPGEVDAVTGACLLISRALFDKIGGFDETRFPVTLNDVDLCLRVRREGLSIIYDPGATLIHNEGQSRPDDEQPDQHERHATELKTFLQLYPEYSRKSVFYPDCLRRDTETAAPVPLDFL
ncbi:glycosyltransferase family 2 protein [Asticcacaulis sp.]|uniref:glycosyltransferase family 2 protein n=1 Tax=Asticcacaulis sp. TaxID=1872648 RepID=UPI00391905BC